VNSSEIIELLKEMSDAKHRDGMARFGIHNAQALGIPVPQLRKVANQIKTNQELSLELWESPIHECKILAAMIGDPKQVAPEQMDRWVSEFYSWDICDGACGSLFDRTPFAAEKALEYSSSEHEFVKRAGFVLMAEMAVHNKKADDYIFIQFFPIIEREAWDNRNFVKKAVNWALRQIGKRNKSLLPMAIDTARRIRQQDSKAARWIASNALAELDKRL
jgi:3-methyladenine DNA glycosylase AlkD